jgi:Ni,Fe-hydrogenase maturation factor
MLPVELTRRLSAYASAVIMDAWSSMAKPGQSSLFEDRNMIITYSISEDTNCSLSSA